MNGIRTLQPKDRIILSLDVNDVDNAFLLIGQLIEFVGMFKIGLELFYGMMRNLISGRSEEVGDTAVKIRDLFRRHGNRIFLDGKFCDIPNTVGKVSHVVSQMGVRMFNVHASAGKRAIEAAVANKGNSLILGVTVLTSLNGDDCRTIFNADADLKALTFARMLREAGADGIICSPQELKFLGEHDDLSELLRITPGVRPIWASRNDQERVMTPSEAIREGADYLVIGRPITNPPEEIGGPVNAAIKIAEEIEQAYSF